MRFCFLHMAIFLPLVEPNVTPNETYVDALQWCASAGKVIPAPSQLKYADIPDGTGIWLRFHEQKAFRWQMKNMPIVDGIHGTWHSTNAKKCGVYNYRQDTFESTNCTRPLNYLCELPNCSTCPAEVIHCARVGNTTYFYHTEATSWNEAQGHCQNHKPPGFLSVNNNKTNIKYIFKKLELNEEKIGSIWVGFKRIGWETGDPDKSEKELNLINWEKGEPSMNGSCVLAERKGTNIKMRNADCEEHHNFVCVSVSGAATNSSTVSKCTTASDREQVTLLSDSRSGKGFTGAIDKQTLPTEASQPTGKSNDYKNIPFGLASKDASFWRTVAVVFIILTVFLLLILILICACWNWKDLKVSWSLFKKKGMKDERSIEEKTNGQSIREASDTVQVGSESLLGNQRPEMRTFSTGEE